MNDYYYKYDNDDVLRSGLVTAVNEHAGYKQIQDLLSNQDLPTDSDYWEFVRVDSLLDI